MKTTDELPLGAIDKFYMQIGSNVKKYRVENSYSQLRLALALNHKSVGLVSQAELYLKKQHFNIEHLYKIAYILSCDIHDLIPTTSELF